MIIAFDVDGVLVDVRKSYYQALARTVSYYHRAPVEEELLLNLKARLNLNNDWDATLAGILYLNSGLPFNDFVKVMSPGAPDFRKFYEKAKELKIDLPDYSQLIEKFETLYRELRHLETLNIAPAVLQEIKSLARVMAVITGRTKEDLNYTFTKFSLYNFFEAIITEDDLVSIEQRKPSPYPLRLLFQKCGYSPPACYVGDTLADWQMVRSYNQSEGKDVIFILYKNPLNSGIRADFEVENQAELLALLKKIRG